MHSEDGRSESATDHAPPVSAEKPAIQPTPDRPRRRVSRRFAIAAVGAAGGLGAFGVLAYANRQRPVVANIPPPATGLDGHNRLIFAEDFTDPATVGKVGQAGVAWFRERPFGWAEARTSDYSVAGSVLRLNPAERYANWTLATQAPSGAGRAFNHGYFEASMRFRYIDNPGADGWPAFWSLSTDHVTGANNDQWMEIDFFEGIRVSAQPRYYGTVHAWGRTRAEHVQTSPNSAAVDVDFTAWNTFGCSWVPGRVTWYLNRRQVLSHQISGRYAPLNAPDHDMTVILGTGPYRPLEVDWVRIWKRG